MFCVLRVVRTCLCVLNVFACCVWCVLVCVFCRVLGVLRVYVSACVRVLPFFLFLLVLRILLFLCVFLRVESADHFLCRFNLNRLFVTCSFFKQLTKP